MPFRNVPILSLCRWRHDAEPERAAFVFKLRGFEIVSQASSRPRVGSQERSTPDQICRPTASVPIGVVLYAVRLR